MAKTLLESVNAVLKRTGVITSEGGEFSTLADAALQREIDIAVQVINEGIDELYTATACAKPSGQGESTITLAATREYTLATDIVRLRYPFIDKTNHQYIRPHPGGYNQMLLDDPEQADTGLPQFGAIRPTDGKFWLSRTPESGDVGNVYTYQYDKDLVLETVADEVPFTDAVWRAMTPVWAELWRRERQNEFDGDLFGRQLGRAGSLLSQNIPRTHYNPRA